MFSNAEREETIDAEPPPEDWTIHGDLQLAYTMQRQMEALEYQHLPNEGGLLDQDECLMTDIVEIIYRKHEREATRKAYHAGF